MFKKQKHFMTVRELVEALYEKNPDDIVCIYVNETITYKELDTSNIEEYKDEMYENLKYEDIKGNIVVL